MKIESWKADGRLSEILKICLASDDDIEPSLVQWENKYQISVVDGGLVRYIPFLFKRLHDLGIDARDHEILRGVYFKSWWVQLMFHKKNIEFLSSVTDSFPKFFLLKGIALQHTIYSSDPRTRPCEDVDIFVNPEDLIVAIQYLQQLGFIHDNPYSLNYILKFRKSVSFTKDAISLDLNWGLYEYSRSNNYIAKMQFRTIAIDGNTFYVLDDTHNLIHTLVHGTGWNSTPSTRWILDAALLIRKGEINWDVFVEVIINNGWQYPLLLQINYLEEFGITVPPETKTSIFLTSPDFFTRAMYFYQRQPSILIRRIFRFIYGDYLAYITNKNLHNSFLNYMRILPIVALSFIMEYTMSIKERFFKR
jgi:hypothetical protein